MEERRDGALERFPVSQNLVGFVTKLNAGDDGRGVKRWRVSGVSDLWLPENWQFTIIDGYWTGVLGICDIRLFAVRYLPWDLECFEAEIPNLVNICLLLCLAAEASSTSNYQYVSVAAGAGGAVFKLPARAPTSGIFQPYNINQVSSASNSWSTVPIARCCPSSARTGQRNTWRLKGS